MPQHATPPATPTKPTTPVPSSPTSVTAIDAAHGQVDAASPAALKQAGNDALAAKDVVRATHMYTLAIDLALAGKAAAELSAAQWFALEADSEGVLSAVLSNRSLAHLTQGDAGAAAEDAEFCCMANPGWPKGHLRLQSALAAEGAATIPDRRTALARALRACPRHAALREAREALEAEAAAAAADGGGGGGQAMLASAEAELAAQMAVTRLVAADASDPRRFLAAGDLGSALAVGAHGEEKDAEAAEHYLTIGADGGDAASQRNLGLLLLELDRPTEAAERLRQASAQGDEDSKAALAQLAGEAATTAERARFQLEAMASGGDERARVMLDELKRGDEGQVV